MSVVADTSEREQEEPEAAAVAVRDFRGKFSEDVAGDYALLRSVVTSAMAATKEVSISCPSCHRSSKHEVTDHRAALDAAKFAVEQGFGKAPQETRVPVKSPTFGDLGLKSLEEMSDAELDAVLLDAYLSDPELLERDRIRNKMIEEALARGETVEEAALKAVEKFGVTRGRIAEALGLSTTTAV